ncbi:MAG TPA: ATP-binding cassette domain-containing protein [Chitinophagaceae bacterium]|nr:ATP-binding cassette domain-containing protein [Chitinophagaceae bacterium]
MNLLELKHLKKYYSSHKAVDDISFSIPQGTIFGLLGPNGAGKTTLLRMITGILFPDSGEICFDGKPFDPMADPMRIGYMPEERGLYKKMKVGEQLLYLGQIKGLPEKETRERIRFWLKKMELTSWTEKKVGDLSKGMQQKVQFISTILHKPKLLILDEPFSGLDPINTNLIKEEIFNLSSQGTTVIFSTHRMEQVEEICESIVLVNLGKKILDGSVKKIKQDFKQQLFVLELPDGYDSVLIQTDIFSIQQKQGNSFKLKLNEGNTTNQILQYFINAGIQVLSFHELLPTVNEIFIRQVEQPISITETSTL